MFNLPVLIVPINGVISIPVGIKELILKRELIEYKLQDVSLINAINSKVKVFCFGEVECDVMHHDLFTLENQTTKNYDKTWDLITSMHAVYLYENSKMKLLAGRKFLSSAMHYLKVNKFTEEKLLSESKSDDRLLIVKYILERERDRINTNNLA